MNIQQKGKPSAGDQSLPLEDFEESSTLKNGSHGMTLNRTFGSGSETERVLSTSIEYHLTIDIPNSSLTRRDLSLLLEILNYQAVVYGVNLTMFMAMYELYFRLLGPKSNSREVAEGKIRLTCLVSEFIFKSFKGFDWALEPGISFYIPEQLKELILKHHGLMSKRTYGSRFVHFRPEKFLRVKIVPVDIQFERQKNSSQRYDSYCKGYGESHPSAHLKVSTFLKNTTKRELSPAEVDDLRVISLCTDPEHLLCSYLEIRYQNEIEEK